MKVKLLILFCFTCITSWMCTSCGSEQKSENAFSEGIIEYKTAVINDKHPLASFAPTTATVKIKNNKWLLEMSTMGIFNIYFCCNLENKTLSQMIKYMNIKNACIETDSMLKSENDAYKLSFKETNVIKKIAGYRCKKVIATKISDPSVVFDVFYTTDIGSGNDNALTPYKEIKGMLMDYRIMRLGLEMHFTATSAKGEEIKDTDFDIPSYYKILTRSEFNKEFDQLFADFF